MAMMKIKRIGLIISYLPVSECLIDSDSEYIIVSLWNISGCRVYESVCLKWPRVNVTSVFWILKARCALQLLLIVFLCLQCLTSGMSYVNSDTSESGRTGKENLWLSSENMFSVLYSYMNVSYYASVGYCSSSDLCSMDTAQSKQISRDSCQLYFLCFTVL